MDLESPFMSEDEYHAFSKKRFDDIQQIHTQLKQFDDYEKYKHILPKYVYYPYEMYVEMWNRHNKKEDDTINVEELKNEIIAN